MTERLVVSFRAVGCIRPDAAGRYLEHALAIKQRAEALGATLCAWSAQGFAFDFDLDEMPEAIAFVSNVALKHGPASPVELGIGMCRGSLAVVGEGGSLAVLSWGLPLVRAVALSRVAGAGEVLVDPHLPQVRNGDLLRLGTRYGRGEDADVRGYLLDIEQPFRGQAELAVRRLTEPTYQSAVGDIRRLTPEPATLGILRAEPGAGGTRLLQEWLRRFPPERVLFLSPASTSQEPLGALRTALRRGWTNAPPGLDDSVRETVEQLVAGNGCTVYAAAEVIDAWLSPDPDASQPTDEAVTLGAVAIDDVAHVDATTLHALSQAMNMRGQFVGLMRLDAISVVPRALANVEIGETTVVGALEGTAAATLARAFTGGDLDDTAADRWGRRGMGLPLGIRTALADSLESGDLRWVSDVARPRRRASGRGPAEDVDVLLAHRARRLTSQQSMIMIALSLLRGTVPLAWVRHLSRAAGGPDFDVDRAITDVVELGWARLLPGELIELRARTMANAYVSIIPDNERKRWHRAVARLIERLAGPLARADAALHAAMGGDDHRAASLAVDAARSAAAVGLDQASDTILAFAGERDAVLADRVRQELAADETLGEPMLPRIRETGADPALERTELEGSPSVHIEDPPSEDPPSSSTPSSDPQRSDRPMFTQMPSAGVGIAPTQLPRLRVPQLSLELMGARPTNESERIAGLARRALHGGEISAFEEAIALLRSGGSSLGAVERMEGLAALSRGAVDVALRTLRAAALNAEPDALPRAKLAYGVALASAGRNERSLLEALGALAAARQIGDDKGEKACASFLSKLSRLAGHEHASRAWQSAARQSMRERSANPRRPSSDPREND